eukprot:XP_001707563.1 Hypothetical protein GL50803_89001 [Giardia lamblia ATCC 50803]
MAENLLDKDASSEVRRAPCLGSCLLPPWSSADSLQPPDVKQRMSVGTSCSSMCCSRGPKKSSSSSGCAVRTITRVPEYCSS